MSARQYVACQFNPWDRRSYTYHYEGEPVAIGDKVVVETARGNAVVEVVGLPAQPPSFETKPIIGKHQPAKEDTDNAR